MTVKRKVMNVDVLSRLMSYLNSSTRCDSIWRSEQV